MKRLLGVNGTCLRPLCGSGEWLFASVVLMAALPLYGQVKETAPIQFSEPVGVEYSGTNSEFFGSGLDSSSSLDDRLSKRLDYINLKGSLSGASTFQSSIAPPRTVTSKKSSGDANWLQSGLLDDSNTFGSSGSDSLDEETHSRSKMLDSLKSDNWLVNGAMNESYWDISRSPNTGANQANTWQAFSSDEFISGLESGQNSAFQPSSSFDRYGSAGIDSGYFERSSYLGASGASFDTRQSTELNGRDAYRELIGMSQDPSDGISSILSPDLNPIPNSLPTTRAITSYSTPNPNFSSSLGGTPNSGPSYFSTRSSDLNNTIYGGALAPRNSRLSEPEEPEASTPSQNNGLSNPLYQAPTRGF